jgi:hypothetical protein
MSEFTTQLAVGLAMLLPFIAAFTFKPEISKLINLRVKHVENIPAISTEKIQTKRKGVTKLGYPDSIEKGVQIYNRRSHIPLEVLFAEAQQSIAMLAVTFHTITTNQIEILRETIYRGVRITFLILDLASTHAVNRKEDFHEGEEVKHHIERSIRVLCEEKKNLPSSFKDNLIIKTYDRKIKHSIMIIDNNLIKIEEHPIGSSPDFRRNSLAFKSDNGPFFQQHLTEYHQIDSKNYECPSIDIFSYFPLYFNDTRISTHGNRV